MGWRGGGGGGGGGAGGVYVCLGAGAHVWGARFVKIGLLM